MKVRARLLARMEDMVLIGLVCCAVFLIAGCGALDQGPGGSEGEAAGESQLASGREVLTPDGRNSGPKGFYPLDIGNRWTYTGEFTLVADDGAPYVEQTREVRSIIGTEERFGREYVLERYFSIDEDGDTLSPLWSRYRQDRAGLYLADIAANEPPLYRSATASYRRPSAYGRYEQLAGVWRRLSRTIRAEHREAYNRGWEELCLKLRVIESATGTPVATAVLSQGPPGGVEPEEITLLKYPLHPSQQWTIRDDPFYGFGTVLEHEVLDLPPGRIDAYKISIEHDVLDRDDWVYLWYGRAGYLGTSSHLVIKIWDEYGNLLWTMVFEEHSFLESLDLAGKGRW